MLETEFGKLIYLVLLLFLVGGTILIQLRAKPKKTIKQASVWVLIISTTIVALYIAEKTFKTENAFLKMSEDNNVISIPLQKDGHFHVILLVNGKPLQFIVDTGASEIVLSPKDAKNLGFPIKRLDYSIDAKTANGLARLSPVRLNEVELGNHKVSNLKALINKSNMEVSLLGMSYLNLFKTIKIEESKMLLFK